MATRNPVNSILTSNTDCLNKWKGTKKVKPVHITDLKPGQEVKFKNPLEPGEDKITFKVESINEVTGRVHVVTSGGMGGMRAFQVYDFEELVLV